MRFLSILALFFLFVAGVSAQTRLVGRGTTVSQIGTENFNIEIVFLSESPGAKLASLGVRRIGTIRIWNESREILAQSIYMTKLGNTVSMSLIGFYVDKGYVSTVRIDTWAETKPFTITDTYVPDWITTGSITKVSF